MTAHDVEIAPGETDAAAAPDARTPDAPVLADPRRWWALIALGVVQFMIVIDNTIVNVALPSVQRGLGFGPAGLTWVVNAYSLAAAGLVLLGGRIADLRGRRRVFQAGTALFALASLCCGLAWNQQSLIAGRFAQGVAEAAAGPAAMALVSLLFPEGPERAKAFGIWGALAGAGAAFGVVASGVLTEWVGWRWIFLINVLPALAVALWIRRLVGESRPDGPREPVDLVSALLLVGASAGVVQAVIGVSGAGWTSPRVLAPGVGGLVLAAVFLVTQRRKDRPLIPLGFFADRVRAVGYLVALALLGASAAVFFLLALYMQQVLGYRPLQNGLGWLPFCAAFMPGLMASFKVAGRIGARGALAVGLAAAALGVGLLAGSGPHSGYLLGLAPGMVVTAFGFGMANPALQLTVMRNTTELDSGLAAGVSGTVNQLSSVLGLAALVTVALSFGDGTVLTAHGCAIALGAAAGALALGALAALVLLPEAQDGEG